MAGDQNEQDNTADDETKIILSQDGVMAGQVGRCEGLFEGPPEQVEIDGYDKAARDHAEGKIDGGHGKSQQADSQQENPVGAGYEF